MERESKDGGEGEWVDVSISCMRSFL